jgi:hypothetical protein
MHVSANSPRIDPQQQTVPGKGLAVPPRQGAGSFAAALDDARSTAGKPAGPAAAHPPAPLTPAPGRLL